MKDRFMRNTTSVRFFLTIVLTITLVSCQQKTVSLSDADNAQVAAVPAFPGAEGFGSYTPHARGRKVFRVTRLDDADKQQNTKYFYQAGKEGSFRWALAKAEEEGGGYIVFEVAGTIQLKRQAEIPSNTYIAGQTAPGTGISITGARLTVMGRHIVIRHIRMRGNLPKGEDAILITETAEHVVLDHVSVSFFRDGAVDIVGGKNVTLQWSHFGDAVDSLTRERYHSTPHLLRNGTDRLSLHHNFYTHAHSRVPHFDRTAQTDGLIEFSNNVVYNFRKYPSAFQALDGKGNAIGNLYLPGKNTHVGKRGAMIGEANFTLHVRDNLLTNSRPNCPGHDDQGCPKSDLNTCRGNPALVQGSRPSQTHPESDIMGKLDAIGPTPSELNYSPTRIDGLPMITYFPVAQNLNEVMTTFGALPRDNTDKRLLNELLDCTGEWKLRTPQDNNVYAGSPRRDRDRDGMADDWEKLQGKNLSRNGHDLHPIYDNIEMYFNHLHDELIKQTPPVDATSVVMRP